jgi:hypothetical protein
MPQNYVMPANAILVNGVPLRHEWEAAPGSAILPGDLVEFNTNYCTHGEAKIKEAAALSELVLGVADVEPWHPKTVAYDAGDNVKVISGNIVVVLRLAAGNDVVCGDLLKPAASGEVQILDCEDGTDDPDENACLKMAQALNTYASATVMQFIIAKLFI